MKIIITKHDTKIIEHVGVTATLLADGFYVVKLKDGTIYKHSIQTISDISEEPDALTDGPTIKNKELLRG